MEAINNIQSWKEAQSWELEWHLNQQFNTYNEETKQYIYASLMGLDRYKTNYYGMIGWDFENKSVVDMGCGETSILLKSKAKQRIAIDPLPYPSWVKMRYTEAGIDFWNIKGEKFNTEQVFDIGIIYNCLQHTDNPEKIISTLRRNCKEIHVFEWINEGISAGHIHDLTEDKLNEWFGGYGKTGFLNQYPCVGNYYAGIFKGNEYE